MRFKSVVPKQPGSQSVPRSTLLTMKVFVILSVFVALAFAEAPLYRQQDQQQRRYYFARQEAAAPAAPEAPYAPSGWKPDGPAFELPERQVDNSYGPPRSPASTLEQQYGAPDSSQAQPQQNQQQQRQRFGGFQSQARQQQFSGFQNQNQRQYLAPAPGFQPQGNQYGVPEPQEQFQPPQPDQGYGPPTTTTEEPTATTETEDATTTVAPQTDSEVEPVNSVNELDEEGDLDEQQAQQSPAQRGEYYVALPDGRLQRIRYVSHEDVEAMKYFARIRAENVEPIRGPIYSYAPLQEVQFASGSLQLAPSAAVPAYPAAAAPASPASPASGKLELQEEAAPRAPVAAVLQYSYDTPSPVIPLGASGFSANYRNQAPEQRYLLSF